MNGAYRAPNRSRRLRATTSTESTGAVVSAAASTSASPNRSTATAASIKSTPCEPSSVPGLLRTEAPPHSAAPRDSHEPPRPTETGTPLWCRQGAAARGWSRAGRTQSSAPPPRNVTQPRAQARPRRGRGRARSAPDPGRSAAPAEQLAAQGEHIADLQRALKTLSRRRIGRWWRSRRSRDRRGRRADPQGASR